MKFQVRKMSEYDHSTEVEINTLEDLMKLAHTPKSTTGYAWNPPYDVILTRHPETGETEIVIRDDYYE